MTKTKGSMITVSGGTTRNVSCFKKINPKVDLKLENDRKSQMKKSRFRVKIRKNNQPVKISKKIQKLK